MSSSPRATPACLKGNGKDCYAGYLKQEPITTGSCLKSGGKPRLNLDLHHVNRHIPKAKLRMEDWKILVPGLWSCWCFQCRLGRWEQLDGAWGLSYPEVAVSGFWPVVFPVKGIRLLFVRLLDFLTPFFLIFAPAREGHNTIFCPLRSAVLAIYLDASSPFSHWVRFLILGLCSDRLYNLTCCFASYDTMYFFALFLALLMVSFGRFNEPCTVLNAI